MSKEQTVQTQIRVLILKELSFATPATQGPGNSRDIDFSFCESRVYALHHRGNFLVLKIRQIAPAPQKLGAVCYYPSYIWQKIKSPTQRLHCWDNANVKSRYLLKPHSLWLFPDPRVAGASNDWSVKEQFDQLCTVLHCLLVHQHY